jgi:integrase
MNFDARTAKTLPAGKFMIFDAHPGLRFQVGKKSRSWIYRYKSPHDGLMKQIKIGTWPATSWNAAIVAWEELRGHRLNNRDPGRERREQHIETKAKQKKQQLEHQLATYTVGELVQDYLKGHVERNRNKDNAKNMRYLLESIPDKTAKLAAATLTRKQAFDLIAERVETPVYAQTLRQELAAAWNYALDAALIPETMPNWWQRILKGKLKSKGKKINGKNIGAQKRVLSEKEIATLLAWLPNFQSETISDLLTMYLWTCARGAEIVAIEAKEITQEDGRWWWTVPKVKTKNVRHADATDLRVPLFGRAQEVILRRLARFPNGYLFPSKRTKTGFFAQSSICDAVNYHQPYCKKDPTRERERLPITYWAPHDLRRSSRTLLPSIGCVAEVAEALLGHMQPGLAGLNG